MNRSNQAMFTNLKLGVFVIAGLLFLVLLLYMIGKNRSLFGSHFSLKAQFENTQGLVPGNNVRFAGMDVGTVKRINILADTLIEVEMLMQNKIKPFIRRNAAISIGTEGFVGNKVVNITAVKAPAPFIKEGDLLLGRKTPDTDNMLQVLNKTNNNLSLISDGLVETVAHINNSKAFWQLLNSNDLPAEIKASLNQVHQATNKINRAAADFAWITSYIRNGKGSVGTMIQDTTFIYQLNLAVKKITAVGQRADSLAQEVTQMTKNIENDINNGEGVAHAILKDSIIVNSIHRSLQHIEQGTASFEENMNALKRNFLFRGYFRRQAKTPKTIIPKENMEEPY